MKVNLRILYPTEYKVDIFVEVSTEVCDVLRLSQLSEDAYERRIYRYNAHYSLDCKDGIESSALIQPLVPEDILENKWLHLQLWKAVQKLPTAQRRRIYARFYLGMTIAEIARKEMVDQRRVGKSIQRGLEKLELIIQSDM